MIETHYTDLAVGDSLQSLQLDVTTTSVVAGAFATRDYSPLHHDYQYATETAGHRDIFLNTMHQGALFQRLLTDNLGPRMRLGRLRIAMKNPVYAGAAVTVTGILKSKQVDTTGCAWLNFELAMLAAEELASSCSVSCAVPVDAADNPWQRRGEDWQP
jgi:acyl dehydratase